MIKILLDILLFALMFLVAIGFWILIVWIFTEITWDVDKKNNNEDNKQNK